MKMHGTTIKIIDTFLVYGPIKCVCFGLLAFVNHPWSPSPTLI